MELKRGESVRSREFKIIALTPCGFTDPSLAIAATRAGALGVLDLDGAPEPERALRALKDLERHGHGPYGVQLAAANKTLAAEILESAGDAPSVAILTGPSHASIRSRIAAWDERGVRTLIQVVSLTEAIQAVRAGARGVIAKGSEAGGHVGETSSFILLQQLLGALEIDVYAHGGIGPHGAAACRAAGAAGVVLGDQLLLVRESPLSTQARKAIASLDGGETELLEGPEGELARYLARPRPRCWAELETFCAELKASSRTEARKRRRWQMALEEHTGWDADEDHLMPVGQDGALAAPLARRLVTVAGVVQAIEHESVRQCALAGRLRPLAEDSPLARSHATRFPIVQGPMTRVSDTAAFASAVAEAGGLPMIALALMRGPEARSILEQTRESLGSRPWGVGILGFVPLELRREQLEVIMEVHPPFAVLAGGRPEQAQALDAGGVATYVHTPSPAIMRMNYQAGLRRFILEGRECGGHVGPRCSFVLWEQMVDEILDLIGSRTREAERCHLLFAGGIVDGRSAAMVEALAAPLAQKGVAIGALMGSAYLFTREAVSTGAIVEGFQTQALASEKTVLLQSGPGHATRCAVTPFADVFQKEKTRMIAEGIPPDAMRIELERLNLGRLRMASKGLERNPEYDGNSDAAKLIDAAPVRQQSEGLYMMGQAAMLRDQVCSIEELHREVAQSRPEKIETERVEVQGPLHQKPDRKTTPDIAIIGMSCMLPGAPDLNTYWSNIRNKVCALREVPKERWNWDLYYDADPLAKDKIYSKWGGFIDEIEFDPAHYGIPPGALSSIEPLQLLTLESVRHALNDAGYAERPFRRETTSIILGAGGMADLAGRYGVRTSLPELVGAAPDTPAFQSNALQQTCRALPDWTEDTFPGLLVNVAAGRVANRFDFGGMNFTIDAACASSLAALEVGVGQLQSGSSDMVIVGGADTMMGPFAYMCFSKTMAFSPSGRCSPLSADADGIVISEGVAMAVLKRLEDAERDGDRIYAVIKAVAGSSDGRNRGLTAPHPEGQIRALRRAYASAGVAPESVTLMEMHATGTVVGDQAELETLRRVLADARPLDCAVGSVKSMIGHTKCAAGAASLLKTALALHHRILPPTAGVDRPNPKANGPSSPIYINTEARPWLRRSDAPRRAGVSAFGFGGTNFHAVLEEYTGDFTPGACRPRPAADPVELLLWRAPTRRDLARAVQSAVKQSHEAPPDDFSRWAADRAIAHDRSTGDLRLAIVAADASDLREKLGRAADWLASDDEEELFDPRGVYCSTNPLARSGKIVFLFPGQGSQYVNMLADLTLECPVIREAIERAGRVLQDRLPGWLGDAIYPPPAFTESLKRAQTDALTATAVAQPALGAIQWGMARLLQRLGVRPDLLAGHSYGELTALAVAGVFNEETLYRLSEARGRFMAEAAADAPGAMAAVQASAEDVASMIESIEALHVANFNGPLQTVIAGPEAAVDEAVARMAEDGVKARRLPVACAFHTPALQSARDRFEQLLNQTGLARPTLKVYANTTAGVYPDTPERLASCLADQLVRPVKFQEEMEALYEAGGRMFIEVGPKSVLKGLTHRIFEGRRFLAVHTDGRGWDAVLHALGQLAAHGVALKAEALFHGMDQSELDGAARPPQSATAWRVNGSRARPLKPIKVSPSSKEKLDGPRQNFDTQPPVSPALRADGPLAPNAEVHAPALSIFSESAPPAAGDPVMAQFQKVMDRFLAVQQEVMSLYLTRGSAPDHRVGPPQSVAESWQDATVREEESKDPSREESPDEKGLTEQFLAIVSDRTGYPPEMLDLDRDMEADLGIDSIKRIEILGALQEIGAAPNLGEDEMEKLISIHTLRGVIEWVENRFGKDHAMELAGAPSGEALAPSPPPAPEASRPPQRYTLRTADAPLGAALQPMASGRGLIIVDDGRGVAEAVARSLGEKDIRTILIRSSSDRPEPADGTDTVDLTSPDEVERLIADIREREGPLGGLLHLRPLRNFKDAPESETDAIDGRWRSRIDEEVKSLFLMARALAGDLREAAKDGGACLIAATAMGGDYGSDPDREHPFFAGHGAIAGMLKSLAREWPEIRIRCVDFDPAESVESLADRVIHEIQTRGEEVEVGYRGDRRMTLEVMERALAETNSEGAPKPEIEIDGSSVILITGGARGITAEVALDLARKYQPVMVLVGRTPAPPEAEDPLTAQLDDPKAIRAALLENMRETKALEEIRPAEIGGAIDRLMAEREIRRTLQAIRQAGSEVSYHGVDVRDDRAFGSLIETVIERHGRIDGVIHGAGVIEDKLIGKKSPESFERVFDTKVAGAFTLARCLDSNALKFMVFFSSVAARFGNRGQIDYAAANETLGKLAVDLNRRWPGRIVAVGWGPWSSVGMVGAELERQFRLRGVELMDPADGVRFLDQEIRLGPKTNAEVLICFPLEPSDHPTPTTYPLIGTIRPRAASRNGGVEFERLLDPDRDLYLRDHKIDGKPVFPMAMALEWINEAAAGTWPGWKVAAHRDLRVLKGIILDSAPKAVRLKAMPRGDPTRGRWDVDIRLEANNSSDQVYYRSRLELSSEPPPPPEGKPWGLDLGGELPMDLDEARRMFLFHGPRLQRILKVDRIGPEGIMGVIGGSTAASCLSDSLGGQWLVDPVMLDCCLQMVQIWSGLYWKAMMLPMGFRSLRLFAPLPADEPVQCRVRIEPGIAGHTLSGDISLLDGGGALLALWEGLEGVRAEKLRAGKGP